jgi:pantoate--beta-alanine ligase
MYRGLCLAAEMVTRGERDATLLRQTVLQRWSQRLPLGRLDYLVVVDPESLVPVRDIRRPSLMACAVSMGRARLIDNIELLPPSDG